MDGANREGLGVTDSSAPFPVTPLRPLGVAEILDGAVRIVRRNGRASLTMSAPLAIVRTVVVALLTLATIGSRNATELGFVISLAVGVLFGTILTGLLTPVFANDLLGRRLSAGQALAQVRRAAVGLLVLALVVAVAEEIGLILLVVGGVWLWGVWAVAAPALVMERTGIRGALGRSYALVKTEFWRTWGIRALGYLLTTVLGTFITLPFSALAYGLATNLLSNGDGKITDPSLYVTIVSIGGLVSVTVLAPITSAIDVLLYTDLRMRREGMDLVLALPPANPDAAADERPQAVTAW